MAYLAMGHGPRPEYVQLKLRIDRRVRDEIQSRANRNLISVNEMSVQLLTQAIVGKPRFRVKMGRAA